MKRKILSALLTVAMITTILTGCGNKEEAYSNAGESNDAKVEVQQEETDKEEIADVEAEAVIENAEQEELIENVASSGLVRKRYFIPDDYMRTIEYVYDETGTKQCELVYDYAGSIYYYYAYDATGNEIQRVNIDSQDGLSRWFNYVFDSSTNMVTCYSFDTKGDSDVDIYTYENEYDAEGNLVKQIRVSEDGRFNDDRSYYPDGKFINDRYEYDTEGKIIKYNSNSGYYTYEYEGEQIVKVLWYGSDGTEKISHVLEYDTNGDIVKNTYGKLSQELQYDSEGKIISAFGDNRHYEFKYEYDSDGNRIKETMIIHSDGNEEVYSITEMEYDSERRMISYTYTNDAGEVSSYTLN